MRKPFIWVALDGLGENQDTHLNLAHHVSECVQEDFGFKVNADWIMQVGFNAKPLKLLPSRPVFVDLKLMLGARTMTEILCMAADAGATATNIHALAGSTNPTPLNPAMLGECAKTIKRFRKLRPQSPMRVYGVTVLTHYGDAYCEREYGRNVSAEVLHLAREAVSAGVDGIIMPGTQLATIDNANMGSVLKIFPGCRWERFSDDRHEQEIHPSSVRGRDDVELVCGSPITKSEHDPVEVLSELFGLVS